MRGGGGVTITSLALLFIMETVLMEVLSYRTDSTAAELLFFSESFGFSQDEIESQMFVLHSGSCYKNKCNFCTFLA